MVYVGSYSQENTVIVTIWSLHSVVIGSKTLFIVHYVLTFLEIGYLICKLSELVKLSNCFMCCNLTMVSTYLHVYFWCFPMIQLLLKQAGIS